MGMVYTVVEAQRAWFSDGGSEGFHDRKPLYLPPLSSLFLCEPAVISVPILQKKEQGLT